MKLKHTFRYRGREWRIYCVSQRELRKLAGVQSNQGDLDGACLAADAEIYYDSSLSPRQRTRTIWHELLHAVDDGGGIGLTHGQVGKLEAELGGLVRLTFRRP